MNISIYTETFPRDPENAQSGLDVLLEPIAKGLGKRFSKLLYMNVYDENTDEFPNFFKNKAIKGDMPKMNQSKLGKYIPHLSKEETEALDKLSLGASKTTAILFIVGADIRLVARARYITKKIGCAYHLYFIDDPKLSLWIKRGGYIRYILWFLAYKLFVKKAVTVFSSTKEHVKALTKAYSRFATYLPLPWYRHQYEQMVRREINGPDRIFYLGSINYLYKENLISLYDSIKAVNNKNGSNIELLTTSILLNYNTNFYKNVRLSKDAIRDEASRARHCVLVYSFERKYRNIVESSFPSKIFNYIPNANSIIYYGPKSHMLADLASQSHGYIIYISDRIELEQLLMQKRCLGTVLSNEQNEFIKSFMYRYSVENFTLIFNSSINE